MVVVVIIKIIRNETCAVAKAVVGGGVGGDLDFLAPLVFLTPLLGLASLYTAAAINSNSALITLAVLNNNGGRRKRQADSGLNELETFTSFVQEHNEIDLDEQQDMLAYSYLSCSGILETQCLEHFACKLGVWEGGSTDRDALAILYKKLLKNSFIPAEKKAQIWSAKTHERNGADYCDRAYFCDSEKMLNEYKNKY